MVLFFTLKDFLTLHLQSLRIMPTPAGFCLTGCNVLSKLIVYTGEPKFLQARNRYQNSNSGSYHNEPFLSMQAELYNSLCHEMCSLQATNMLPCLSYDRIHMCMPCQVSTMQIFHDIVLLHIMPFRYDKHVYDYVMKEVLPGSYERGWQKTGHQDNPFRMLPTLSPYLNGLQAARTGDLDPLSHCSLVHLYKSILSII